MYYVLLSTEPGPVSGVKIQIFIKNLIEMKIPTKVSKPVTFNNENLTLFWKTLSPSYNLIPTHKYTEMHHALHTNERREIIVARLALRNVGRVRL